MSTISAVKQVLDANDRIADSNSSVFDEKGIVVICRRVPGA